jgi:cell division protein FtsL
MSLIDRRVRGFRLIDLVALGLLVVLILGVYLAKTMAGRERAEIARIERQIAAEKARIRLLQAEVTHLEQPARIERLSTAYLGLAPVSIKRETTTDSLLDVARNPAPPVVVVPPPAQAAPAVAEETGAAIEAAAEDAQ